MIGVTHQTAWLVAADGPMVVGAERHSRGSSVYTSKDNLSMLALGVHNGFDVYPRGVPGPTTPNGSVRHSWATGALMSGMLSSENDTGRIEFSRPWNDPTNQRFFQGIIPLLINPDLRTAPGRDADGYGLAHYAANSRAMANGAFRPLKEFTDGTTTTLLIGAVNANFRPWGDPANCRDPARGVNRSPHGFGGPVGAGGALFALADGSVRFVSERTGPTVLRALATPDGGEDVDASALRQP
jgi:hypothetical protein